MKWLPCFLLILFLVGCAGQPPTTPTAEISELQIFVGSDDFAVGRPRIPIVLYDGPERVADVQAVSLTAFDLATEPPTAGWQGPATNYSDYEVPYWVLYPDLPKAGLWGFGAEITLADGRLVKGQFAIQIAETNQSPAVGDPAPATTNAVLSEGVELTTITSDPQPEPALYQMTIDQAVASGRVTVIAFATPAFCQSELCAPVVNSLKGALANYGDQANFIHVEIYADFQELTIAEPVNDWKLSSEPWTFILDGEGKVRARLGGPVSTREITDLLEPLLP